MTTADARALLGEQSRAGSSSITGYGRDAWVTLLANMTAAFAEAAELSGSPARPWFPGAEEARLIEGLEGFARMSVAWGAWLGLAENSTVLNARGRDVDVLELVTRGFDEGTNRKSDFWWGEFGDREQRIVEAAELATGLWLGRDRIVPALGAERLEQLLGWLDGIHGKEVYDDNWWLFPVMVACAQRALGWRVDDRKIDRGIDWMVEKYRGDGWYADGHGHAFDLYTGWAIHWHLMFWARIDGVRRPRLARLVEQRYASWLRSIVHIIAPDGSRPLFGRSLGYRFAFAAPLSLSALLRVEALPLGLARRAATSVIAHDVLGGAFDPTSGWLLRGVGAERPDVCERYISRGAAAWAAHSLVALGLPASDPFWTDEEQPLPSETGEGELALRGPGFLVQWRAETGDTTLLSGLADHPEDIPGHDYAPYYGKLVYRSGFPLTVRSGARGQTPDGAILVESKERADTRRKVDAGGAGPSWIWSDYRMGKAKDRCTMRTVVVSAGDGVDIRVTGVEPRSAVRVAEAPAALGVHEAADVTRAIDPDGVSWASDGRRYVAVRALAGYDEVLISSPTSESGPDRNLISDHAEQPVARESAPSDAFRVLATASCAVSNGRPSLGEVKLDDAASDIESGRVALRNGERELIVACVGPVRPSSLAILGREFTGDELVVARAATDGSAFAGESVTSIAGVLRLERAGPVAVRRSVNGAQSSVEMWVMNGIKLDRDWSRADLARLEINDLAGWKPVAVLDEPNVISAQLTRRLQKAYERTLLHLRLT